MAINETKIKNDVSAQVKNQIAQQRQSINNTLGIQKKQYDETINRNKSYLNEQIVSLKKDKNINDDKITTLQNRRGGFYSGGLDYQLGENLKANQGAQTAISRDINDKNSSVLGEYNTLARQASENIRLLEQQAPDKIRELVNAELSRQKQEAFQREQFDWNKKIAQQQEQLRREQFEWQKKMDKEQQALAKLKASRSGSSRGGSSSSSGGSSTSAKSTPIASQFRAESKASQSTSTDRYYEAKMKQLNEGRSLARKPIQELYPGLVPNYRTDKSLSYYDRNKILLDSLRGR